MTREYNKIVKKRTLHKVSKDITREALIMKRSELINSLALPLLNRSTQMCVCVCSSKTCAVDVSFQRMTFQQYDEMW